MEITVSCAVLNTCRMAGSMPIAFSSSGEYCIFSSPDGVLKLWETSTSKLKQQYTPSSHLTAICTCLSWGPSQYIETSSSTKKKKRRSSVSEPSKQEDIVAIGTSSGSILLYSIIKADIQAQLDKGHSDSVNDLCWDEERGYLYSCGSDHHVIQWDVSTANVKQKWKADKGSIHSVRLCTSNHLLTAGRSIKLWDVETTELLKTFTGHKTEVFSLSPIHHTARSTESPENMYFISAARNDRTVNAWQIVTSTKDKNSIASFLLPEEPLLLDVSNSNQVVLLCVVTRSGQVVVFEHTLNGRLKKPLKPKVIIQIATAGSKESPPQPIPILGAQICLPDIIIVHGNLLKPTFEKVPYNSADPLQCLVREDPRKIMLSSDKSNSKIKTPDISKDCTVLIPGLMAPNGPSQEAAKRTKRNRKSSVTDMSMEDRLNAISVDHPGQSTNKPPQADTLVRLLTQGLQSQDQSTINNVLRSASEKVIQNTVQKLPIQSIIPLVQELSSRIHTHADMSSIVLRWLKTLLTIHTSYLMTFPDMVENLSSIYQMMDSRTVMFHKLSRLQGKLDLVLSQIANQDQAETDTGATEQPLLMYQEESSDEDFALTDFAPTQSDTEDNLDLFDDEQHTNGLSMDQDDEEMESDEQ